MKRFLFIPLFILLAQLQALAQENYSACVVDAETGEPLPYVSIYVAKGRGPLDFNPYVYARNNPYSYIDRNGELPFWVVFGIVMGGAGNVLVNIDNINRVWYFCE